MNTQNQQVQNAPFKFNSLEEAIADDKFKSFVVSNIQTLRKQRNARPAAAAGMKYKRNWYDRMTQDGTLNEEYFIKHIKDILNKTSDLPAEIRKVIEYVCEKAIAQTCKFYTENPTVKK